MLSPTNKNSMNDNIFINRMYKEQCELDNKEKDLLKKNKTDKDDDISKLGKLSIINASARHELLNANKMLLDLDVTLSVYFYMIH